MAQVEASGTMSIKRVNRASRPEPVTIQPACEYDEEAEAKRLESLLVLRYILEQGLETPKTIERYIDMANLETSLNTLLNLRIGTRITGGEEEQSSPTKSKPNRVRFASAELLTLRGI